jgi:hypothetical protein
MFIGPIDGNYTFGDSFKWVWLYPCLPFIGSLIALVFYEYVFKKAVAITS